MPATFRANSTTAYWKPPQLPKNELADHLRRAAASFDRLRGSWILGIASAFVSNPRDD
jgi:hypothetical protein